MEDYNMTAWNDTPFNREDFVLRHLGPRRMSMDYLLPITIVYFFIFLSGIVGNICTCVVISRNQYMQTATNCYLFNLAIADMMTLLFAMPFELYTLWHQYPWPLGIIGCYVRSIIPETTANASILTIVVFSTERYIAICHPIRQQTKAKLSGAVRNIAIVWLVSLVCAMPFAFSAKVNYVILPNKQPVEEACWCGMSFVEGDVSWIFAMIFSSVAFFLVPFALIIVMYVFIWLALRRSKRMHRSTSESARLERERSKTQSRRAVIRLLVAVVLAFFICWAPFHTQRLMFVVVTVYSEWTDTLRWINQSLFTYAGCFYYFNSTINPILYSVMSNRFRVAFREKLCAGPPSLWCVCCCCFCCVKDYESRSQQTPRFYRNSNSHSSVRSYISYPHVIINNNTQRCNLVVDYCQQSGGVSASLINGNANLASRSSSGQHKVDEMFDLAEREIEEAIRQDLDKLEDRDVICTDCSLLFPPRQKNQELGESSMTELSDTPSRVEAECAI